ncbi:hypothetical protein FRC16_002484 [Serendipita sp. 398]|nr:hypothetical protein FRC16_002484 [Serendipita sp. 398]
MTAGLLTANTPSHNASSAAPFEYSSEESGEKTNKRRIAPAMHTPYLRVAHLIRIATYLSFEKDGQIVTDVEETSSSSPSSPSLSVSVCRDSSPASSSHSLSTGLAPVLPAYSQLFHEDGEARIDATRGVPPVYRPSTPLGSSSVPSQQQLLPEGEVVISKPELVPVGTTVIDWEKIPSLI